MSVTATNKCRRNQESIESIFKINVWEIKNLSKNLKQIVQEKTKQKATKTKTN